MIEEVWHAAVAEDVHIIDGVSIGCHARDKGGQLRGGIRALPPLEVDTVKRSSASSRSPAFWARRIMMTTLLELMRLVSSNEWRTVIGPWLNRTCELPLCCVADRDVEHHHFPISGGASPFVERPHAATHIGSKLKAPSKNRPGHRENRNCTSGRSQLERLARNSIALAPDRARRRVFGLERADPLNLRISWPPRAFQARRPSCLLLGCARATAMRHQRCDAGVLDRPWPFSLVTFRLSRGGAVAPQSHPMPRPARYRRSAPHKTHQRAGRAPHEGRHQKPRHPVPAHGARSPQLLHGEV